MEKIIGAFIGLMVGLCVLFVGEIVAFHNTEQRQGMVLDKSYSPERNSTGSGLVSDGKGGTSYVMTNEHESEKWKVILQDGNDVVTADAAPQLYYAIDKGAPVAYVRTVGRVTGIVYGNRAVAAG